MIVESIIEIPMGTKNKFEIDKKRNRIKLDRVLYSSAVYPGEYGYIDETLAEDGDALDILVISSFPTFPGCLVDARVVGYLELLDRGKKDHKIISVSDRDPRFNHIQSLNDIPEQQKQEIKDFFTNYKKLQNIPVVITDFHSKEEAIALIEISKEEYKKTYNN